MTRKTSIGNDASAWRNTVEDFLTSRYMEPQIAFQVRNLETRLGKAADDINVGRTHYRLAQFAQLPSSHTSDVLMGAAVVADNLDADSLTPGPTLNWGQYVDQHASDLRSDPMPAATCVQTTQRFFDGYSVPGFIVEATFLEGQVRHLCRTIYLHTDDIPDADGYYRPKGARGDHVIYLWKTL